jgi:hypothetical protein
MGASTGYTQVLPLQLTSDGSFSQYAPVGPSSTRWNDKRNDMPPGSPARNRMGVTAAGQVPLLSVPLAARRGGNSSRSEPAGTEVCSAAACSRPPRGRWRRWQADERLAHALWAQWPSYVAYLVSFLIIGVIWLNHHRILTQVARVDGPLLLLNLNLSWVSAPLALALCGAMALYYAFDQASVPAESRAR